MSETLPSTPRKSFQNEENVIIIWFESIIDTSDEIKKIKDKLKSNNDVSSYNDASLCSDAMKSIEKNKIFLIISDIDVRILLDPTVYNLRQLNSIFIFPASGNENNTLFDEFSKIVDIFANSDELLTSIEENLTDIQKQIEMFSFYDQNQQATQDLSEESAKFLWFQLFKDVIISLPRDDQAKEEMINACRQYYRNNQKILNQIDDFRKNYEQNKCISWYTKDTFLYSIINKALRTADIDQLYTFRYYIADLSNQLASEYQKLKTGFEETIDLYRGMIMTKRDAEKLQASKGKLIAVNSYWSTSRNNSVASLYANKETNDLDTKPVIFKIKCDLRDKNDCVIFADIISFSQFSQEKEVLFDIGAVFKIEDIIEEKLGNTDVLIVTIKRTGEGQEITTKFIEENRQKMLDESPTMMFCTLLKRMGKVEKSLPFLEKLSKDPGKENLAHIYNRMGVALRVENKYDCALEKFQEAYELATDSKNSQWIYAALILYNKGRAYYKKKQFKEALEASNEAIKIIKEKLGDNNNDIAKLYSSIGRIYLHQGSVDEALEYQRKALKIREECLSSEHVVTAFSYADIGNIYFYQKNYDKALEYHNKALGLRQKSLPPDHHNITWSLCKIGKIFLRKRDLELAGKSLLKSLQISENCVSNSLNNLVLDTLDEIILTYGRNLNAILPYRLKTLEIRKKIQSDDTISIIVRDLRQIVQIYDTMHSTEELLIYYKELVHFQKHIKPIDYSILADDLNKIARIYKSINNFNESIKHYEEVEIIREEHLFDDPSSLAYTVRSLASVYEKLGKYAKVLEYYNKEMKIFTDRCHYSFDHVRCRKNTTNIAQIEQLIQKMNSS